MRRCLVVLAIALSVAYVSTRARQDDAQICAANLKTLVGAWEMYCLDK